MTTTHETLSSLGDWARERWPDLADEQVEELRGVWEAAEAREAASSLPAWMLRGMAPDSSDADRDQFGEYAEDVTNRARAVGLLHADEPPAQMLPAVAEVLAWLEARGLIAGSGNEPLPPRCAICYGPTVETAGWLCSPCYADPWRPPADESTPPSAEEAVAEEGAGEAPLETPVLEVSELPAQAAQQAPTGDGPQVEAVPVAGVAGVEVLPAAELPEDATPSTIAPGEETAAANPSEPPTQPSSEEQPAATEIAEPPVEVPLSLVLPDFAQPADAYAALCTDGANRLHVEMVLYMDRLPHRWRVVYSSTDAASITGEQYSVGKTMHANMERELAALMTQASWQQTDFGGWKAPWEPE